MSEYNKEQHEALCLVRNHLAELEVYLNSPPISERLKAYLAFRKGVDDFLAAHFSDICNRNCYRNRLSACCSKEGIVTFFADVVINMLESTADEIEALKVENAELKAKLEAQAVRIKKSGKVIKILR